MGTLARSEMSSLTLKERMEAKKSGVGCLILDISGSMNSDCEPGKSKMDALHDILDGLVGVDEVIIFDYSARFVKRSEVPRMGGGGTHMAKAINLAKMRGMKRAVMITDGDANDKPAALEAVKGFGLQIMYVGGGKKPDFLDDLAKAGGGYCTKDDIKMTRELTTKVQALLAPPTDSGRGNIQL